jgi:anthranilate synthase component 1
MYYPSFKEFLRLSLKGNVIPVYKEINADLDTPVSAFLKIAKGDYAFLLESVEGQEKIARYSFIGGGNPALIFKSKGRNIEISKPATKSSKRFFTQTTPLDEIKKIMQGFNAVALPGLPRFCGGLVGYLGYDMVRFFERIPDKNPDDLKLADAILMLTDNLLIFDHINHTIKIVNNLILPDSSQRLSLARRRKIYTQAIRKIESIHRCLKSPVGQQKTEDRRQKTEVKITSNFKKREFQAIVKKAKDYINKGDIIQVVLSQRFKIKTSRPAFEIYRNLRSLNPSPYMFFLKLQDIYLVGASPEMLVRCENNIVQTRPIAGTRPRGRNDAEDKAFAGDLINDKKEKAEHIMLVDLGRNDLGRVCQTSTVTLSEFMTVEKYSHVMHLVSEVKGRLRDNFDIYDCLKAAFPAGTVSGSPKIRAMQIIDELENLRRGPYAGCVGYFSFSHNMDTCITIRTIVLKGNFAYIQAGAGIVTDSLPEKEYDESVNKAKALIEAIDNTK